PTARGAQLLTPEHPQDHVYHPLPRLYEQVVPPALRPLLRRRPQPPLRDAPWDAPVVSIGPLSFCANDNVAGVDLEDLEANPGRRRAGGVRLDDRREGIE